MQVISAQEIAAVLDWGGVLEALRQAHLGARPAGDSYFVGDERYGLFSRGVVLPSLGAGLKVCSIHPANSLANPPLPTEQAAFLVIDEQSKAIVAILDGPEITRWKTAADSALAAQRLSREDSAVLLVLGAGPVARALVDAYLHIRPAIREVLLVEPHASEAGRHPRGPAAQRRRGEHRRRPRRRRGPCRHHRLRHQQRHAPGARGARAAWLPRRPGRWLPPRHARGG